MSPDQFANGYYVVPEEKEDVVNVIITVLIQETEQNNHSQRMARTTRATASTVPLDPVTHSRFPPTRSVRGEHKPIM